VRELHESVGFSQIYDFATLATNGRKLIFTGKYKYFRGSLWELKKVKHLVNLD
jgi:hypothetical protein